MRGRTDEAAVTRGWHLSTQGNRPYRWPTISAPSMNETATRVAGGRHIFISYSSKDAAVVGEACRALEEAGLWCWFAPRDIVPGQTWSSAIVEGIDKSRAVVLVLSRSSAASGEVLREVQRASSTDKPIVTFRIEKVEPSGGLAYFLPATQWLDALHRPLRPSLEKLVAGLHRLLEVEPPPGTPSNAPREIPEIDLDRLNRSHTGKNGLFERLFRDR
jgi:TIR domain